MAVFITHVTHVTAVAVTNRYCPPGARPKAKPPQQAFQGARGRVRFQTYLINCGNCGKQHIQNRCTARGKQCHSCGKLGHFGKSCKSTTTRRTRTHNPSARNVQDLEIADTPPGFDQQTSAEIPNQPHIPEYHIEDLFSPVHLSNEIWTTLHINGKKLCLKLDTGARCNMLPKPMTKNLTPHGIPSIDKEKRANLVAFGGSVIPLLTPN